MSKVKSTQDTGEVIVVSSWRKPRSVSGLEFGPNIIQHQDFAYDVDSRCLKVVDTDKEDREAYIQSFASECGIYNVLKNFSKTGDLSLLNAGEVFYGDVSNIPADELDPGKVAEEAAKALSGLNGALGSELTAEQLASMSAEELNELISKAVAAQVAKASSDVKEGE